MKAVDCLIKKIKSCNNPSVIGLDPHLDNIPDFIKKKNFEKYGYNFKGAAEAVWEFNKCIIDATFDLVPAVKPQIAFYEVLGEEGIKVFRETCMYAKAKGLIVIGDVKRGDICSTAEAYSDTYLGRCRIGQYQEPLFDIDFITVNPYFGSDSIEPFLEDCRRFGKGIFILVKTSNKSSGDLQDLKTLDGKFVYEHVAELVNKWGKELIGEYNYSSVGAVIGATYPNQIVKLRKILNHSYILIPGYGAQGGTAEDVVEAFDENGLGAIVSSSRSIIFAYKSERWKDTYDEKQFAEAARAEVIRMRDDLNAAISKKIEMEVRYS